MAFKFDYYLYFKHSHFILLNRNDNTYNKFLSFRSVYLYLIDNKIKFDNVQLKGLLLSDLFAYYCRFDDYKGERL